MADLKHTPVAHDHAAFLAKAAKRKGFKAAYDALELEYQVANQMLKARSRAGMTQDDVAGLMGTTKSAISRLEAAGKHAASLDTLKRYAQAVGCDLQVKLVPHKALSSNRSLERTAKKAGPRQARSKDGARPARPSKPGAAAQFNR